MNFKPKRNRRFKDINVDVIEFPEPDAVAGDGGFAEGFAVGFDEVILVFDTENIVRDPGFVCA